MLFVALSLFAGASGEKKGKAVEEIVIAVPALPATMEPGDISNQTVAMYKVFMNMYDTLIKIDYKNNTGTEPGLAESWKRIDDTTLELYLRKGAKFHDGSEFTADDVVALFGPRRPFSKDSIMGKDKNFPNFKEVQKIDDYTVRIITKKPDPAVEQILSLPSYSIISSKGFNSTDFKEWQFKPIGTGPYKIVEFVDAEQLVLEANQDYWGGKPAYKKITFKVVPEVAARIAGLSAGDFNIITDVPPDMFSTVEATPDVEIVGGAITTAVKDGDEYKLFTGNQTGAVLVKFVLEMKKAQLNEKSTLVKTIVTSELGANIARSYGLIIEETLTGFKYIGDKINKYEASGEQEFVIGYEESYGYLVGTHARDKDGVVSSMLICQMAAWYKNQGKTLVDALNEIYAEYGYYLDYLDSFVLKGKDGAEKIQSLMTYFRDKGTALFDGVSEIMDFSTGIRDLPNENVLKYIWNDGSWMAVRPSGTEPKIKVYYSIVEADMAKAQARLDGIRQLIDGIINA